MHIVTQIGSVRVKPEVHIRMFCHKCGEKIYYGSLCEICKEMIGG